MRFVLALTGRELLFKVTERRVNRASLHKLRVFTNLHVAILTIFRLYWSQYFRILDTLPVLLDVIPLSEILMRTGVDLNWYAEVLLVHDLLGCLLFVSEHRGIVSLEVDWQGWTLKVRRYFGDIFIAAPRRLDLLVLLKEVSVVVFLNRTI